jgi:hypothetical protein
MLALSLFACGVRVSEPPWHGRVAGGGDVGKNRRIILRKSGCCAAWCNSHVDSREGYADTDANHANLNTESQGQMELARQREGEMVNEFTYVM